MATEDEIEHFLQDFKMKMKIFDVLFRDERNKNTQALADLEIRPIDRKKVLEDLCKQDYSYGPIEETLYRGAQMWIFGKEIKGHEVFIKITMGIQDASVICISFHLAEHPLRELLFAPLHFFGHLGNRLPSTLHAVRLIAQYYGERAE